MLWLRPDRITHVDVDMQKDGGARQFTAESVRRPPFLWSLESQHDFQGVANRALRTAAGSGNLDQRRRPWHPFVEASGATPAHTDMAYPPHCELPRKHGQGDSGPIET